MFIFLVLVLWGLKIARYSRDLTGALTAFGVTMFVFWGIFINIGMVIGIFPVVGIPLPFFQLWWVFDDCSDDRSGSVDECEHEEVYPSTMMALIVPLVSLRRGTKRGDLE